MNTNTTTDYSEYAARIPTDPSYYGCDCTDEDADRISDAIADLVRSEFPGINVAFGELIGGSNGTTGPDSAVCQDVDAWIERNWTKAL